MIKTLKWIYRLGYNRGIEVGRQELLDEQENIRFSQEMFDKITEEKL